MKLVIKILLLVFVVLVNNVKVVSAAATYSGCQQTTTSFSYYKEMTKIIYKVIENGETNYCQNGNDLVDYRNRVIDVGAAAAKTGFNFTKTAAAHMDDAERMIPVQTSSITLITWVPVRLFQTRQV